MNVVHPGTVLRLRQSEQGLLASFKRLGPVLDEVDQHVDPVLCRGLGEGKNCMIAKRWVRPRHVAFHRKVRTERNQPVRLALLDVQPELDL